MHVYEVGSIVLVMLIVAAFGAGFGTAKYVDRDKDHRTPLERVIDQSEGIYIDLEPVKREKN